MVAFVPRIHTTERKCEEPLVSVGTCFRRCIWAASPRCDAVNAWVSLAFRQCGLPPDIEERGPSGRHWQAGGVGMATVKSGSLTV